jgi:uncharacterized RDD family membrane protein YckC
MSQSPQLNPYMAPRATPAADQQYSLPSEQFPLASRVDRFVGALIDGVIVGIPTFVFGIFLGIVLVQFFVPNSLEFQIAVFLVGLPAGMGIFLMIQGYLLANHGQTVGKWMISTRILDEHNQLVPLIPLILKRYLPLWIVGSVPYFGAFFVLGNALAIFRANHKCIHDDIAGTKVVKIV